MRISPSNAHVWVNCPGSIRISDGMAGLKSDEAAEGITAHYAAAHAFFSPGAEFPASIGGLDVTEEMIDGALGYVRYFEQTSGLSRGSAQVEKDLRCERIHSECAGRCDCWVFNVAAYTIHVYDYKFGFKPVDAFENWQLLCYAAGILQMLTLAGMIQPGRNPKVVLHVYQPRNYRGGASSWEINGDGLLPYFQRLFEAAHRVSMSTQTDLHTGEHCGSCNGRFRCPLLTDLAGSAIDLSRSYIEPAGIRLSMRELGFRLAYIQDALERLEAFKSGLEAEVDSALRLGVNVPNWELSSGGGRKAWSIPSEQVIAIGMQFKHDFSKPMAVITPTQAIEKVGAMAPLLKAYYEVKPGALKLRRIGAAKLRKIFKR